MKRTTAGFTLVELVIVILIGSILTSISFRAFGNVQTRLAARGAMQTFEAMHARARAQAVEYGEYLRFHADATGDSIWIQRDTVNIEVVDLGAEFNADLSISSGTQMTLCMNPRGWAETSCNNFSSVMGVWIAVGSDTTLIAALPLGQLVELER